ncbi:glycosyltransferase family 39 protein [Amycolatopsis magusensis]|uniref:glycosyltransferase family 39 protein n=1 Tax=Amycolatopsis magusensis TaxID=882444 RepID=UPI0024A8AF4E|nr:glycosyltransferase family 39 protein [Amycolatopsis magusensis]MDI5978268.1 glycosyltransferase family 39 protein [Amycolatopsis magusensis]
MTATTARAARTTASTRWPVWTLAGICVLAALLYAWGFASGSWGNTYYTAGVKAMSSGFTDFLFGAYDPAGAVSVDKPPMSLWPQVVSVWIFGYHGWAILLPQVLAGVGAVFLLHRTVRRWAGEASGLFAALLLALTPITVAVNQVNLPDTLLVLLLVAAAYAVTRSIEDGRHTGWLLWSAFFVGCAFTTKMLQAWIVVPGLAAAFLVGASGPVRRKLLDLLAAGLVLFVSSFWWPALRDWWPGEKPYMASTADGTAMDLIFGYNGFGRLFGAEGGAAVATQAGGGNVGVAGGASGVTRMFGAAGGGQISWLLPLALLVLVLAAVGFRKAGREWRAGWVLWGGWLLLAGLLFSFAQGVMHPYTATMLAPAVAALCAAGIPLLWRAYRGDTAAWVLLPLAVAGTAAWAWVVISRNLAWHGWLRWAVLVAGVAAVLVLVLAKRRAELRRPALVLTLTAIVLAPAVWSVGTAVDGNRIGVLPSAGPLSELFAKLKGSPGGFGGLLTADLSQENRRILAYAKENSGGAEIVLAVERGSTAASPFLIHTDETVVALGGYAGADPAPSPARLSDWVAQGRLRFVLSSLGQGPSAPAQQERAAWLERRCVVVDPAAYGGQPTQKLFSCT